MKAIQIAAVALVLCLTGCATFNRDVAPKVAAAVMTYCATPQAERLLVRQSVNQRIAPNAIQVTCAGDQ